MTDIMTGALILLHPGKFFMIFFKNNFSKNSFGYTICVKQFGSRSNRNTIFVKQFGSRSGLIWVQTVCKGYQQTTLVGKELLATYICMSSRPGMNIRRPQLKKYFCVTKRNSQYRNIHSRLN